MCEHCYHEDDPVKLKLDHLTILLNGLTLHGMIDWQACSRPNDSLGRTAIGFRLAKPLRIDGKDYWISVYKLRFPNDDEDTNGADLEITCLQDGSTENFHGYWSALLVYGVIASGMRERHSGEGTSKAAVGNKKERQIKLLDTVIKPLDAVLGQKRIKA